MFEILYETFTFTTFFCSVYSIIISTGFLESPQNYKSKSAGTANANIPAPPPTI